MLSWSASCRERATGSACDRPHSAYSSSSVIRLPYDLQAQRIRKGGTCREFEEQRPTAVGRQRTAEVVALRELATVPGQYLQLPESLNALRHHAKIQTPCERQNRAHDRLVRAAPVDLADEAAVDLDRVDRQPSQIAQARVSGAEVIDQDAHTVVAQVLKGSGVIFRILDECGFRDLECELMR